MTACSPLIGVFRLHYRITVALLLAASIVGKLQNICKGLFT